MITNLRITPLEEPRNDIVGFATATFDDTFTVNSITIRQKQDKSGYYVRMPQKKTQNGNYIDVAHPLSPETRQQMNNLIINSFQNNNLKQDFNLTSSVNVSAQNCVKYTPGKYGNALGRLDIVVNDMVIHNCKVIAKGTGEPYISMPNFKDREGNFHSLVVPSSKEAYKEMTIEAMREYNTEYMVDKCNAEQLKALEETDIKFSAKATKGDNFAIKFNADDVQRVQNVLKAAQIANIAQAPTIPVAK